MSEKSPSPTPAPDTAPGTTPGTGAGPTHAQRRAQYGLNVAVAIAAAVGLVVIVNLIAFKYLYKVRVDMTARGVYSLSPQTRDVLKAATDDYRIVTLFGTSDDPKSGPYIDRARDLIAQYAYVSDRVKVDQIDPVRYPARLDKFYAMLRDRYRAQLAPADAAIKSGQAALPVIQKQIKDQIDFIDKTLEGDSIPKGRNYDYVTAVGNALKKYANAYADLPKRLDQVMNKPLPDYTGVVTALKTFQELDNNVYFPVITSLQQTVSAAATPDAAKNKMLEIIRMFQASRQTLREPIAEIQSVKPVEDYDNLQSELADQNAVVILGPNGVRVVNLQDMFRAADNQAGGNANAPVTQVQFLGEEMITGALVSLEVKTLPLVVFVTSGGRPVTSEGGDYANAAKRLRAMNFTVSEWSPGGQMNPMTGRPMPPSEPPSPKPGQKAVWIVLPIAPGNPMVPDSGGDEQTIVDLLSRRMAQGDGAMVMIVNTQAAGMGMRSPLLDWVKTYDVTPLIDRVILQETQVSDRKTGARANMSITQWPTDLNVTRALGGRMGMFVKSSPLLLGTPKNPDEKIYPLVRVTGTRLWAERDLYSDKQPTYKADEAADSFTLAAAVQRGGERLVVVTDPIWASDEVLNYGTLGPGTAGMTGEAFPANGELFVNCVLWLSDLDKIIAASARSQDIRRVGDMNLDKLAALKWAFILGMPALIAALGVAVWSVRRRG